MVNIVQRRLAGILLCVNDGLWLLLRLLSLLLLLL